MKNIKIIETAIRKIMTKESAEFGEFKNDPIAWRAANLVYDNGYSGVTLGRLYGYLQDESSGNFNERKFFDVVQKLKDGGDYIVQTNPSWHKGKIYHTSFKKSLSEGKLLASAPTEERIIKLISDYFYGSTITLTPVEGEPNRFDVHNKKGPVNNFVVLLKGGKYRFEQI